MIRETMKKDVTFILDIYNDAILNSTAVYAYKPVTLENRIDWY
ncbi:N-acetyltransferase, partial [Bacillus cereus]